MLLALPGEPGQIGLVTGKRSRVRQLLNLVKSKGGRMKGTRSA